MAAVASESDGEGSRCSADCPQPCRQTVYEPSLSYALLSTLSVDQILSREDFDLEGKYGVALETVQRVNSDTFTTDLKMLTSLKRHYEEMKRHVSEFLNEDVEDAIAIKLLEAVGQMRIITVKDCNKILGEFHEYKKEFESKFSVNIKLLQDYHTNLRDSYQQLRQGMELYTRKILSGYEEVDEYLPAIANNSKMWASLTWATIDVLYNDMLAADPNRQNEKYVPVQYFTGDTREACVSTFKAAQVDLASLSNLFSAIERDTRGGVQRVDLFEDYVRRLNTFMTGYTSNYDATDKCVQEFSSLVNRIVTWLGIHTQRQVNETNKQEKDRQEEAINQFADNRDDLNFDIDIVTKRLNRYSRNLIMKMDYLKAITEASGGETTTLLSKIELFTSRAQSETVDPLKTMIDQAKKELESWYKEALNFAVDIDGYLTRNYFWQRVGEMDIWKLPSPNLEEATSPYFLRETLEFWRIWDPNMPIKEFVQVSQFYHFSNLSFS